MKSILICIGMLVTFLAPCAYADDPAVLYRVASSSETVIVTINESSLVWTNAVPGEPYDVECSTGIDVPWQPVDSGTAGDITVARSIRKPTSPVPVGMSIFGHHPSYIGDVFSEGATNELPLYLANTRRLFIDQREVTCTDVKTVLQWAYDNGHVSITTTGVFNIYGDSKKLLALDDPGGAIFFTNGSFEVEGGFDDKPITHVSWYGALAFCNYRSAIAGLPLAINVTNWTCNFNNDGFRLPLEKEWEKAARGSIPDQRFPWDSTSTNLWDDIDGSLANYWNSGDVHETTNSRYLTPVGTYDDNPNPINLRDMAGNVYEWCWDWYDRDWYSSATPGHIVRYGPTSGVARVVRGGAWCDTPDLLRVANRSSAPPHATLPFIGFRCVRWF